MLVDQIGRLKVEVEWLKKMLPSSNEEKRRWIEPGHPQLGVVRQCELIELTLSSCYYQPLGESAANLILMRQIDDIVYSSRWSGPLNHYERRAA